jgi:lipid A 4'-phosphatase
MDRLLADLQNHPTRWALGVLLALMFVPGIDFALSTPFYRPGIGFTWDSDGILEFARGVLPNLIIGSLAVCLVFWLIGLFRPLWVWRLTTPRMGFLLLTLLVGPGLIVEALLKPFWGRARPKDIVEFGGDATYTSFWQVSHACDSNCSFVSGHAAVAFWMAAYAFLLPRRWQAAGIFAGLAFGLLMGLVRIMQGGHFATDVAGAGFIVLWVNVLMARLVLKRQDQA